MTRNVSNPRDPAGPGLLCTIVGSRSDLLKRVERWTYGRKVALCKGLAAKVITASEAMLAHGLSHDEIGNWMKAYRRRDFEALKVGYLKRCRAARKPASSSRPEDSDAVASG